MLRLSRLPESHELLWVLLQLLTQRFGPIHDSTRLRIQSADTNQLEGWFANVLDAKTLDEALAD